MTSPAGRPVLVLNGPNLGRLGRRQPQIYGSTTHDELVDLCVGWGRDLGLDVEVRQTNHEGALLDWLTSLMRGALHQADERAAENDRNTNDEVDRLERHRCRIEENRPSHLVRSNTG